MKNNKTIIIIGIILFIIVVLYIINNFLATKNNSTVTTETPQQGNTAVPLPNSGTKNQVVDNPKNLNEVNSALKKSLSQPIASEADSLGFQPIKFKDKNNQIVPLQDFAAAAGITINSNIQNLLRENDYFVFRCPESSNNMKYGIVFHVKLLDSNNNLPADEAKWMKDWEKTIFKDTAKIIFPDNNFSDAELNQPLQFKDGKYRFADISLGSGKTGSMNYAIIGDYLVITSSKDCLDKVSDYVEPVEP